MSLVSAPEVRGGAQGGLYSPTSALGLAHIDMYEDIGADSGGCHSRAGPRRCPGGWRTCPRELLVRPGEALPLDEVAAHAGGAVGASPAVLPEG